MREQLTQLLRESDSNSWVAEHIGRTLAHGISMPVKDTRGDAEFYRLEPITLSKRERKKRETYETTRPYTEEEAVELIREAFRTVFVELPAVQEAAINELREIGLDFGKITFAVPDEPEREDRPHTLEEKSSTFSVRDADERVARFFRELGK